MITISFVLVLFGLQCSGCWGLVTGQLTFYGAGSDSGGTCMYYDPRPDISNTLPTIAVGDWQNAIKCGTCIKIYPLGTGSGNSDFPTRPPFVAYINNQCPECGTTNVDLAQTSDGRWDIEWEVVPCPISGTISLQLKTGSSQYYTAVAPRDFIVGVQSVDFWIGGTWVSAARQSYNYFLYTQTVTPPVQVRLTSIYGESVITTIPDYNTLEPGLIPTTVQFTIYNGTMPDSPATSTPTGTPSGTPTGTPTGTPSGTPTGTPTGTPSSTPTPSPPGHNSGSVVGPCALLVLSHLLLSIVAF